jgi:8-oxo-dGTP pyrophosphatase MutT (NUDIX family)
MTCRKKPDRVSSGIQIDNKKHIWKWNSVKWTECKYCGFFHSDRQIPDSYWDREWITAPYHREKVGIVLVKNNTHLWVTESYHNCYGFPKGEKEENESITDCAKREFYEETGNDSIKNINLDKCMKLSTSIENITYIFFVVHVPKSFEISQKPIDDVEITSFGWKHIRDVGKLKLSKAIRRIYNSYIRHISDGNKFKFKFYNL